MYILDLDRHEKHLGVVFNILIEYELYANCKKCVFGQSRIQYPGHLILE